LRSDRSNQRPCARRRQRIEHRVARDLGVLDPPEDERGHSHAHQLGERLELLQLADVTAHDVVEGLSSDIRIAPLGVSRWEFVSAPRRYELAPELEAQLAPLRRG
jgi:hypothetical protein